MGDLTKYFEKMAEDLKILSSDIQKIAENKKSDKPKDFKKTSLKSLQKVTKLYKNKEEIDNAKKNPEVDFVLKKLEDIFRK